LVGAGEKERAMTGTWALAALWLGLALVATFGLSHSIIDDARYSLLVAGVIGSAVVPTLIANAFYLPRHLPVGGGTPVPEPPWMAVEPKLAREAE
jgi:hypothetical protein